MAREIIEIVKQDRKILMDSQHAIYTDDIKTNFDWYFEAVEHRTIKQCNLNLPLIEFGAITI